MWGVRGFEVGRLGDAQVLPGRSGRRGCSRFGWIVVFSMISLRLLRSIMQEVGEEHTLRSEVLDFLI
jgi:hypothetical protein